MLRGNIGKLALVAGAVVGGAELTRRYKNAQSGPKKKIVVLGGGYAGRTFVKTIDTKKYDVVLVDRNLDTQERSFGFNLFNIRTLTFQPQPNYVDSISDNKVVNQYMYLPSEVKDIKDECIGVDQDNRKITLKANDEVIDYDYLVFATGSIPDTYNIQMHYNCNNKMWYFFKDRSDLETLMTVFNIIGLEDVVIMGGGITGVELASELSKRIKEQAAKDAVTSSKTTGTTAAGATTTGPLQQITILEAGDRLLPKLKETTSAIITKHLESQNVKIITSANITSITRDGTIKLLQGGSGEQGGVDTPKEVEIKAVVAVWTCGVKPDELAIKQIGHNNVLDQLQLVSNIPSVLNSGTATATTSSGGGGAQSHNLLQSSNAAATKPPSPTPSTIFAIGDCNNLLPKSAQHAKQQGAYLAQYFNSDFKDSTPPFACHSQGSMIRLSDRIFMDSPAYTGFLPLFVHHFIIWLDI